MLRSNLAVLLLILSFSAAQSQEVERINVEGAVRLPAFSHATASGDLVFVSGTLGTRSDDAAAPELADGVAAQTTQTLLNIERTLEAAGSSKEQVLKCNVYLTDMSRFAEMNEAYIAFFGEGVPARTTVGVNELALGALVEIECIALRVEPEGQTASARAIPRTSGFIERDGEQIYYDTAGAGHALVFCHGLGGNHAIWYQQVAHFAENYRVITWDQRGFGRSTNNGGEASPQVAVEDLAALLDALEIEKAHVVGQSMGGWAALGLAIAHPERVASLVLADTIGGIYTPAIEQSFDAYIQKTMSAPGPAEWPLGFHPAVGEQLSASNFAHALLYAQIGSVAPPAPPSAGLQLRQTRWDLNEVRKLAIPVLFIVGEDDPIFPVATIREAAAQTPDARVEVIAGTGHSPYFERPEAWNGVLKEFLGSVP